MNLSAPKMVTWLVAVVAGGLGLAGHFVDLGPITQYQYWLMTGGWGLLTVSTALKGI